MLLGVHPHLRDRDKGLFPLDLAVISVYVDVVRVMVKLGAEVNVANPRGLTALHIARGGIMVDTLVEAGADIEARDGRGDTPLLIAVCSTPTWQQQLAPSWAAAQTSTRGTRTAPLPCTLFCGWPGNRKAPKWRTCC